MGIDEGALKKNPEVYMEQHNITMQMLDLAGYEGTPTGGTAVQQFVDDFDKNSSMIQTPIKFLADKVEDYLSEDNLAEVAKDIVEINPDIQAKITQWQMDPSDVQQLVQAVEDGLKVSYKEGALDGAMNTLNDFNVFKSGDKEMEGLTQRMENMQNTAATYADFAIEQYKQTDPKGIAIQIQQEFPNVTEDTGLTVAQLVQEQLKSVQEYGTESYTPDLQSTYNEAISKYENTDPAGVLKNLQTYTNLEEITGYAPEEMQQAYMHARETEPDSTGSVHQFVSEARDEFEQTAEFAAIQQEKALEQKMNEINQDAAYSNKVAVVEYVQNGGQVPGYDLQSLKQADFNDPETFAQIEASMWQPIANDEIQLKSLLTMDDMHIEDNHLDRMAMQSQTTGDKILDVAGEGVKETLSFLGEIGKGLVSDAADVHVDSTGEKIGKAAVDTVEGTAKGLWGIGEALVDAVQGDFSGAGESLKNAGSSFANSFDDNGVKADVSVSDHFKAAKERTEIPAANDREYGVSNDAELTQQAPKEQEQSFLQKLGF